MNSLKSDDMALDPSCAPKVLRPLCKFGACAISCVYPAMAIPFIYSEINQQSTQKMLNSLGERLDELESKNLVTQDYLTSEHYVHLMVDILRKVYSFNTDQKRESVAKIYKDTVQNKVKYADSDEKLFIEAIEKINTQEIQILTFMSNNGTALETIDSWNNFYELYSSLCRGFSMDKYKFKYFVTQLEQMGLVFCSDLSGYDKHVTLVKAKVSDEPDESSAGVTPLGKEFLKYLKK